MQLAFQNFARSHSIAKAGRRSFNTSPPLRTQNPATSGAIEQSAGAKSVKHVEKTPDSIEPSSLRSGHQKSTRSSSTELVPQTPKPGSLQRPRRSDIPARLLPKAQISPELTLSPKERLRIELETRRPPRTVEKPVFKERLLIYHAGLAYTNYIALLRATTMFATAFGLVIMAPAYYFHENTPWWTVPLILVGTAGPFFLVKFLARPFVSWIYLTLPQHARRSPRAALEYSKNLPQDALLQISFMRATALTSQVEVNIADLVPRRGRWPPSAFEWVGRRVDKGTWLRSNPTHFFVNPRSATGRAARDTVPGIWQNVYARIMGIERGSKMKW